MNATEMIAGARACLAEKGMAKHTLQDGSGRVCLYGALWKTTRDTCQWPEFQNERYTAATLRIYKAITEQYPERPVIPRTTLEAVAISTNISFNNDPETTPEMLDAVLAKAELMEEDL